MAKGEVIAWVSHEMRSPISAIFMGLEFLEKTLERRKFDKQQAIDILADVKLYTGMAKTSLDELISFRMYQNGVLTLNITEFRVIHLLRSVISLFTKKVIIQEYRS